MWREAEDSGVVLVRLINQVSDVTPEEDRTRSVKNVCDGR